MKLLTFSLLLVSFLMASGPALAIDNLGIRHPSIYQKKSIQPLQLSSLRNLNENLTQASLPNIFEDAPPTGSHCGLIDLLPQNDLHLEQASDATGFFATGSNFSALQKEQAIAAAQFKFNSDIQDFYEAVVALKSQDNLQRLTAGSVKINGVDLQYIQHFEYLSLSILLFHPESTAVFATLFFTDSTNSAESLPGEIHCFGTDINN